MAKPRRYNLVFGEYFKKRIGIESNSTLKKESEMNGQTLPVGETRILNIGSKKYTQVVACDKKEFNANHSFIVESTDTNHPISILGKVKFQKGPIKEAGVNGVMNEDLIAMVIDRLYSFQESERHESQVNYHCRNC